MTTSQDFQIFKQYTRPDSYCSPEFSLTGQRRFSLNFHNGREIVKIYDFKELSPYMGLFTDKFSRFTTASCLKASSNLDTIDEHSFCKLYKEEESLQKIHAYFKNIVTKQTDDVYIGAVTQDDSGNKFAGDGLGLGLFANREFEKGDLVTSYGGTQAEGFGGKYVCYYWDAADTRSYGGMAQSSFPNVQFKEIDTVVGNFIFIKAIENIQKDEPICAPYPGQANFYGRKIKMSYISDQLRSFGQELTDYFPDPNSTWKYIELRPTAFRKFCSLSKSNPPNVKDEADETYMQHEKYANDYAQYISKDFE